MTRQPSTRRSQVLRILGIVLSSLSVVLGVASEPRSAQAERLTFSVDAIESSEFVPPIDPSSAVDPDQDSEIVETESPVLEVPQDNLLLSQPIGPTLPWRYADLFKDGGESITEVAEIPGVAESFDNLPIIHDDKVEGHIRYFHVAIRDRFEQWLVRLAHYKPLVENIFSEFNLPSDLVFLSLVESGFNPHAYSRARATGPWQFMKGTAKLYGLRVDRYVDERRDPIKSTVAAARYLRDLYDLFGTWPLAMAAYNAGEGKVMRALQKARAEDFWEISRTKLIRRETKEYVPRFMAATIIAKNPDQYGFTQDQPVVHQFDEAIINRSIHLKALSAASGLSLVELRRLNPELRLDVTPPDVHEYHLKVPVGAKTAVYDALEKVPTWKPSVTLIKKVRPGKESGGWYKVRVGDSLWTIAKRLNVTVHELRARNSLANHVIKPGDLLMVGSPR
ncbi:MAG: transglycosylase SLT domain-containing protein [Nitrospiraceae bacterium]